MGNIGRGDLLRARVSMIVGEEPVPEVVDAEAAGAEAADEMAGAEAAGAEAAVEGVEDLAATLTTAISSI